MDKASHFKINRPRPKTKDDDDKHEVTQIERACAELGIIVSHANSPQAKGRIERLFRTMQDRLLHSMRFEGITNIDEANTFLGERFLPRFNEKFSVKPACEHNVHRPVEGWNLDAILSVQDFRSINKDSTFKYMGTKYQIHVKNDTPNLSGKQILIENRIDGTMRIRFDGIYYNYSEVGKFVRINI
jgi:hypothetical protein